MKTISAILALLLLVLCFVVPAGLAVKETLDNKAKDQKEVDTYGVCVTYGCKYRNTTWGK